MKEINKKIKNAANKILFIIEDDPFLVKAYSVKFKKEGIETQVATDGEEAVSYLGKEPPALVLLDLMIPKISGFEVLEAMRKNEKWKNVPVIILTNLGQAQDMERGKELRVSDYIIKANVKINDIVEKVKKYF